MRVKDHLGNEYPSVSEMCKHYNISRQMFYRRIRKGWSLAEALCTPLTSSGSKTSSISHVVYDHLGNKYESIQKMCEHYGLTYGEFQYKIRKGLSVKDALTLESSYVTDHLGNKFCSKAEMCRFYGISADTYTHRLEQGFTQEQALCSEKMLPGKKACVDHLGNEYGSIKEMLAKYGLSYGTFVSRKNMGWNLAAVLTTPIRPRHLKSETSIDPEKAVYDHLGNAYKSEASMCKAYGLTQSTFQKRRRSGYSLKDSLTHVSHKSGRKGTPCTDHLGNEYFSYTAMCRVYGTSVMDYWHRIKKGYTKEEALLGKMKSF